MFLDIYPKWKKNLKMKYGISYLIKKKIINPNGSIPGFTVSYEENKKIIQYLLYIINHPIFIKDPNIFLSDNSRTLTTRKSKTIHPFDSALYIVRENLETLKLRF